MIEIIGFKLLTKGRDIGSASNVGQNTIIYIYNNMATRTPTKQFPDYRSKT